MGCVLVARRKMGRKVEWLLTWPRKATISSFLLTIRTLRRVLRLQPQCSEDWGAPRTLLERGHLEAGNESYSHGYRERLESCMRLSQKIDMEDESQGQKGQNM